MKLAPNSVEFGNIISIALSMDLAGNLEGNEQVLYAKNTKTRQHHKYSAQTLRKPSDGNKVSCRGSRLPGTLNRGKTSRIDQNTKGNYHQFHKNSKNSK
jgi:hypothetical protein